LKEIFKKQKKESKDIWLRLRRKVQALRVSEKIFTFLSVSTAIQVNETFTETDCVCSEKFFPKNLTACFRHMESRFLFLFFFFVEKNYRKASLLISESLLQPLP
jgi:hypothetical protein